MLSEFQQISLRCSFGVSSADAYLEEHKHASRAVLNALCWIAEHLPVQKHASANASASASGAQGGISFRLGSFGTSQTRQEPPLDSSGVFRGNRRKSDATFTGLIRDLEHEPLWEFLHAMLSLFYNFTREAKKLHEKSMALKVRLFLQLILNFLCK